MGPKLDIPEVEEVVVDGDIPYPEEEPVTMESLQVEVASLKMELYHMTNAVVMLRDYIKTNGLKEFWLSTVEKSPKEMTREELIERNSRTSSARIATSKEALAQPDYETLMELYKPKREREPAAIVLGHLIRTAEAEQAEKKEDETIRK